MNCTGGQDLRVNLKQLNWTYTCDKSHPNPPIMAGLVDNLMCLRPCNCPPLVDCEGQTKGSGILDFNIPEVFG